jgi:iron complex outermembrane receptor protein
MNQKIILFLRMIVTGTFLVISFFSFSENSVKRLSGKIVDISDVPVVGASIVEKGTTNGTTSDLNGRFNLAISGSDVKIQVKMLGYKPIEVSADSALNLVLHEDFQQLGEMVVIGYGSVKKEDLTGSVSSIKAEEINRGAVTSSTELLKGKISGVLVLPDGAIRIRGLSSLNASNDPLIVVDGVPLSYNGMSSINPDDIESFTVLKDASAAAIYGSRAASGVIIITTKKPVGNKKFKVTYNGTLSMREYAGKTDVLSADEFRAFIPEIYGDSPSNLAIANSLMGDSNTDWLSLVTQTGITQTHNLAFSGSVLSGIIPYRLSLSYIGESGTTKGSWSKRPGASLKLSPNLFDNHLNINLNMVANTSYSSNGSTSYSAAANFNPTLPVNFFNNDGSIDYTTNQGFWVRGTGRGSEFLPASNAENNPMQYNTTIYDKKDNLGYILNGDVSYRLHGFEDLTLKVSLGIEGTSYSNRNRTNPEYWGIINDAVAPRVGTYYTSSGFRKNEMLESYASYKHDFDGHNINAILGYSWEHFYNYDTNETRLNGDYSNEASGVSYTKDQLYGSVYKHGEEHYLISFYTRLNYSYNSKYLLTFTLRDDGSSRFAKDNRWAIFPSVALAWNIKEENFLKENQLFSQLKLRTGWGITGQESGIANYSYLANYVMSTDIAYMYNMGSEGLYFSLTPQAYDPNIKWEETVTQNVGLDFGFIDGRITGSIDLYNRKTNDLLNSVTIPLGANFSNTLLTNIGNIENKGAEFSFDAFPVRSKDMTLSLGLTFTKENTKFTKLTIGDDKNNADYYIPTGGIGVGTGGYIQQQRVGYAPQVYYLYQQIYDNEGKAIQNALVDRDNNGIIDDNDRYLTDKNPLPDFFYGFRLKFSYKKWDFGFNGHGSKGNWVFNNYARGHSTTANDNLNYNRLSNFHRAVFKTGWNATNTDPQNYSDMWLEDASFLKIDDINLGYTFGNIFKNQNTSLRVAASANNVLKFTKYSGVDPEVSSSGVDGRAEPRTRTISLRAILNF